MTSVNRCLLICVDIVYSVRIRLLPCYGFNMPLINAVDVGIINKYHRVPIYIY